MKRTGEKLHLQHRTARCQKLGYEQAAAQVTDINHPINCLCDYDTADDDLVNVKSERPCLP